MRRILKVVTVAAGVLLMAASAFAAPGFEVGARGAYWFPELSGTVQTTTNGIPETTIDVKKDLGVENKNLPFGEAHLRLGRVTFRVGYTELNVEGNNRLSGTIVFNGITYAGTDDVASKLDLKMLDGEVQYDLLRPDAGVAGFNLGLLLHVKYADGMVEIRSKNFGDIASKNFKVYIPMVGVAAGAGVLKDMVRVDVRAAGIAYSGNHLYDADAYASFAPLPFVRIQGGYRYIDLKADKTDMMPVLKMKGPYVGAQVSF
jgi:outer membrane protein